MTLPFVFMKNTHPSDLSLLRCGLHNNNPRSNQLLTITVRKIKTAKTAPMTAPNKAMIGFDQDGGEMVLSSLHPGVTLEEVQAAVGWPLKVAGEPAITEPPTAEELRIIREELDPEGIYST